MASILFPCTNLVTLPAHFSLLSGILRDGFEVNTLVHVEITEIIKQTIELRGGGDTDIKRTVTHPVAR